MAGALLVAVALLVAGCSSGKKQQSAAPTSSSAAAPVARRLDVALSVTARGPEHGFNAGRAARQASPALDKFLNRYLTVAFLEPAQARSGWRALLGMFDTSVRSTAMKQLDSLSLGSAAARVTAVRPGRAQAHAVVLFVDGHPAAATVRLSFDGTADSGQGSGQVRLRSVLQLLGGPPGWRIIAYDSNTGGKG